ncbi:MAG: hypothetical protein WCA77_05250, partial [Thermoplasmata archaeon]
GTDGITNQLDEDLGKAEETLKVHTQAIAQLNAWKSEHQRNHDRSGKADLAPNTNAETRQLAVSSSRTRVAVQSESAEEGREAVGRPAANVADLLPTVSIADLEAFKWAFTDQVAELRSDLASVRADLAASLGEEGTARVRFAEAFSLELAQRGKEVDALLAIAPSIRDAVSSMVQLKGRFGDLAGHLDRLDARRPLDDSELKTWTDQVVEVIDRLNLTQSTHLNADQTVALIETRFRVTRRTSRP